MFGWFLSIICWSSALQFACAAGGVGVRLHRQLHLHQVHRAGARQSKVSPGSCRGDGVVRHDQWLRLQSAQQPGGAPVRPHPRPGPLRPPLPHRGADCPARHRQHDGGDAAQRRDRPRHPGQEQQDWPGDPPSGRQSCSRWVRAEQELVSSSSCLGSPVLGEERDRARETRETRTHRYR